MNIKQSNRVSESGSTHANSHAVSGVGSALGADKKINLECGIFFIVHVATTTRATTQRRSADVRGDGLCTAHSSSMAGSTRALWAMEFSLYPLASVVPAR